MEVFMFGGVTTPDGRTWRRKLHVHDRAVCSGQVCVIHNPSVHHMRDWPLGWRDDIRVMERVCPHGVGHPDPDHLTYVMSVDVKNAWQFVHGCDSCCIPPANVKDVSGDCNS